MYTRSWGKMALICHHIRSSIHTKVVQPVATCRQSPYLHKPAIVIVTSFSLWCLVTLAAPILITLSANCYIRVTLLYLPQNYQSFNQLGKTRWVTAHNMAEGLMPVLVHQTLGTDSIRSTTVELRLTHMWGRGPGPYSFHFHFPLF